MSASSLVQVIQEAQCIVIKVGSNVLVRGTGLDLPFLYTLAEDIHELRQAGKKVVIVTSGSIATAMVKLATPARPKALPLKQAYAAVGQLGLMWEYERAFRVYNIPVAQVLLTRGDLENRKRYLNSHNTFMALFDLGVIPIVNENDTVATDEIRFGDNDSLSAMVAGVVNADVNIILSDIDGLYTANPQLEPGATHIALVTSIDEQVEKMAGNSLSSVGTGGMITKMQAAKICMNAGIHMIIGCGRGNHALRRLMKGKTRGTLFEPSIDAVSAKKRWILQSLTSKGKLVIDDGARQALTRKDASLLPIGVTGVQGRFERGDCVDIVGADGVAVAKGLALYSSDEIVRIKGKKSTEIEQVLGYTNHDDLVHRDNMVLYNA
ncbi:glutamate 5-kinase [Desulfurispirillum indicum S5]|uniref:Glutamate 5-kinase n=1 Tax=Desulfurispirillum indicum (strain ATCC BAA-1389 / DSM 22839 / S5) TaxID=653733 RepID=E6W4C4_DESIS|nr:glutamate 5-kinase [Desulfurispirillum indicum]ADU65898.1 glutamate 5-kinase [Desulfurispirillum indicum S5]